MNPTGSFKDTGMTAAISVAVEENFAGGLRFYRKHFSVYGGLCGAGWLRSLVLIPEGKISWGSFRQALDYGALTCQLRTDFDGCLGCCGK